MAASEFLHCAIFLIAASVGSGPCPSASVADHPLRPATHHRLGGPLLRQLTNATHVHLQAINSLTMWHAGRSLCGISQLSLVLSPTCRFTYVFTHRAPVSPVPKNRIPFDLHVLSPPPAFVLSQDQTLHCTIYTKQLSLPVLCLPHLID